ncbi:MULTISPECIES: DMT family transporter [unclassified Massilia]|uniref:DMT family transporter n=1 Tax=unclassified Massilia TaxID=2609279 RepID=UPI00177D4A48|nr:MULTISPECIES: DMT family transporter [unclassified Massilia]MBD8530719.1 DMT family transporter [Massilia sp. CFBP 13647]MBD8676445.1 DMT family transporter [Massilia sp. CFBP 13721]
MTTTIRLAAAADSNMTSLALPLLFIAMWSSGYVVGKLAVPYAPPFTLLTLRFGLGAALLLLIALATRAPWPSSGKAFGHLVVVGLLIQALQFSGLYTALKLGVSAGESALIVGTMPVFTALGAALMLGERTGAKQWLGMAGGVLGVLLVVWHKLGAGSSAGIGAYACAAVALAGITLGTLYQKKYCAGMDLRTGGFVQLAVATLVALPLALGLEGFDVHWTPTLVFASGWLSIVNSIGATSLLFVLMRKGEASKVASLFYLIPGVTALLAFAVLGETLNALSLAGFVATGAAVWLCTRAR